MTQLTETIADAIKKNLPQQIGEELQKELAELTKLRVQHANQADMIQAYSSEAMDLKVCVSSLESEIKKHKAIDLREAEVLRREQQQNFSDFQVAQSEDRRKEMLGLVGMVFRSPVYQTTVSGKVPVPVEGVAPSGSNGYGTPGMVMPGDVLLNTTNSQF